MFTSNAMTANAVTPNGTTARRAPIGAVLKAALPAAAFVLALAGASASHGEAYYLNSASMNQSNTAHIYGPGGSDDYVWIAPVLFNANLGTAPGTPTFDILAFCVDIYHNMYLGPLGYKYDDTQALNSDSNNPVWQPLTGQQINHVSRLVNYGQLIWNTDAHNAASTVERLAGIQGAIWEVINPLYNVVAGNGAVNGYINVYADSNYQAALTGYGHVSTKVTFITETGKYRTPAAHQSFAFAAAPEPAAWMMLILGFGGVGALLRRRRMIPVRA